MKIHSQQQVAGTLSHIREANDEEVQIVPGKKRELTPMGKTVLTVMAACVVLGIAGVSLFEWKNGFVHSKPVPVVPAPYPPPYAFPMNSIYALSAEQLPNVPGFFPEVFSNWRQTSPKTFPELLEGDVGPGWFTLSKREKEHQLYIVATCWLVSTHPGKRMRCTVKISSRKKNGQRVVVGYRIGGETIVDPWIVRNTILHQEWLVHNYWYEK